MLETAGNRDRARRIAWIAGLTAVGAFLRFYGLGRMGLWLDESNSVIIAAHDLPGIIERLRLDSSPPLYYLLLHIWIRAFGPGNLAVKSLSAVFGTLLIPATYLLGRETAGRRVGLWAAGLLSVAPLSIYYSRETRMYSLLALLAALQFFWALRVLRGGSRSALAAYLASGLCCLYTHNYGVFACISTAALAWGIRDPAVARGRWLLWQGVIVVLYVPWVPVLLEQLRNPTHYSWLGLFWKQYPSWAAPFRTLEAFVPGGPLPAYLDLNVIAGSRVWSGLLALVFLVPAVTLRGGDPTSPRSPRRVLAVLFLVPLLLPFVYSFVLRPVYVVARTDTMVYPVFLIAVAAGALRWRRRALPAAGLAVFLGLTALTLFPYYGSNRRDGDREIALHSVSLTWAHDLILCTGLTRASIEYYVMLWHQDRVLLSFPFEAAEHMGSLDETVLMKDEEHLELEAQDLVALLESCLREGRQCLVLRSPMPINRILWSALERNFSLVLADPPGGFRQAVLETPINVGRLSLPPREN